MKWMELQDVAVVKEWRYRSVIMFGFISFVLSG
jgi:hypothetical protein